MQIPTQKTTPLFFALILLTAVLAVIPVFATPITVTPEKTEYKAGESLTVSGTATPNTDVTIQLFDPANRRIAIAQATANSEGAYTAANIYTFSGVDPSGTWTVKAYDPAADEWAEATLNLIVDVTPPTLTITVEPVKATYKNETITIIVTSDEELKEAPTVTVTQTGATPVTVEVTQTAALEWTGTYTIMSGYDGPATIEVTGADVAGNQGTATKTIVVEVVPAWQKPLTELKEELEAKIADLEAKISTLEGKVSTLESDVATLKDQVATLSGAATISYVAIIIGIIAIIVGIIALVRKPKPA